MYVNDDSGQAISDLLDEEIRQLTELKRMAANPRLVDLMRKIVAASPAHGATERQAQPQLLRVEKEQQQHVADMPTYLPNGLTAATLEAIRAMKQPFTIPDLVERLH